ncbi:cell division protein ZapE [Martelella limonii]|uniref:cell division protein ZapE n=1 Tax=Martelella limonii TaxID=1647649 RepID=UPI00157FE313|nr:cell division protein ZapE [Martelella limonii]
MAATVTERLKALIDDNKLAEDSAQSAVAAELDAVLEGLRAAPEPRKGGLLSRLFGGGKADGPVTPGLYIFGSVGRGKTMLMDMFFDLAPVADKRRSHFLGFMADVQDRLNVYRRKLSAGEVKEADPIGPVADEIIAESRLLCFDEFTVTDIADAMILSRLFSALFQRGCVLVATSNVAPDDLYKDGLNRALFLPFVDVLKKNVTVTTLDSATDYRMEKFEGRPVYLTPLDAATASRMDENWTMLTGGREGAAEEIEMRGRVLQVPRACGQIARFSFDDLCRKPLGGTDYLAIAKRYRTVFIDGVPVMSSDSRNEIKRFIMLIDTLYDQTIRTVISAEAMPEALLPERKGREGFEFERTASRLFEMRSSDYLAAHKARWADK